MRYGTMLNDGDKLNTQSVVVLSVFVGDRKFWRRGAA